MACLLTAGIPKGCRANSGGIKRVLLANYENITAVGPALAGDTTGTVTAITMPSGTSATTWYAFVPNKLSSNYVENIQASSQNGTFGFDQVITLIFAKNEASKRNAIMMLGQANLMAIVEDFNAKYWLLGEQNGIELTAGSSATGTALGDLNGYTLTISGPSASMAREVTAALIGTTVVVNS